MSTHIITWQNTEFQLIQHLTNQITANPSENPELFCQQSKQCAKELPPRIQQILQTFSKTGSNTGFLLFIPPTTQNQTQTPPTITPDTPQTNNQKIGETTTLAKIQSILIHATGEMISYEAEGYGRLFQDVIPIKTMEQDQTSTGSNKELEIHTEQAFSKLRPDILSLACLRSDPQAYTYLLPVQKILESTTQEEQHLLQQPLWKTGVDLSFKINGHEFIEGDLRGPLPILNHNTNHPQQNNQTQTTHLVFDQDLMQGITPQAQQIITKIVDIYYQHRFAHNLLPGEIILIDNQRSVHGRSPFYPKYDGKDRFLIRCFATTTENYQKSEYARKNNSRMVSSIYS